MIPTRWMFVLMCCATVLLPVPGVTQVTNDYSAPTAWLCLPDRADVCSTTLTSTVFASGTGDRSIQNYAADHSAPVDCFYVYPTVSREARANADMAAGPEEQHVALDQFARFAQKCRPFAPLYRQITLTGLSRPDAGADYDLAYRDVLNAWRFYLAHQNQRRGVVLIGHSQGASLLTRLLAEEVDGKEDQRRLVSAILLGTSVQVPEGKEVGGTFQHIPLCGKPEQTGCLIAYSSYLADPAPGPDAIFGAAQGPGMKNACVNPAALLKHATLDTELPAVGEVAAVLGTNLVENPGVIQGTCTTTGNRTYLAITVQNTDSRAQRLAGALTTLETQRPGWGLHVVDIDLTLGDLAEIVGREGQAWRSQAH